MDDGARDELPQVVGPIASVIKLRRGGVMKTEPEMNEKKPLRGGGVCVTILN